MIRLATVLLIASAYFSPAHAAVIDLAHSLEPGLLESAGSENATLGFNILAADRPMPLLTKSITAPTEPRTFALARVPLPSSIWFFIAALAAGLMVIRRRIDRA